MLSVEVHWMAEVAKLRERTSRQKAGVVIMNIGREVRANMIIKCSTCEMEVNSLDAMHPIMTAVHPTTACTNIENVYQEMLAINLILEEAINGSKMNTSLLHLTQCTLMESLWIQKIHGSLNQSSLEIIVETIRVIQIQSLR